MTSDKTKLFSKIIRWGKSSGEYCIYELEGKFEVVYLNSFQSGARGSLRAALGATARYEGKACGCPHPCQAKQRSFYEVFVLCFHLRFSMRKSPDANTKSRF